MPHAHTKLPACANCHYAFPAAGPDEFCPQCGQQNHEVNLGFGHLVEELLEGVFHFDGKVFRTAGLLLFRPGQLTRQFLQGHRAPYVPPIRLYVFISFVFFALLSLLKGHSEDDKRRLFDFAQNKSAAGASPSAFGGKVKFRISTGKVQLTSEELERFPARLTAAQADSVIRSKGQVPDAFSRQRVRALVRWRDASREEAVHQLFRGASILLFLLMPLAALLLKGAYFRQHLHYISHLVFTVHVQCFLFVFIILLLLLLKAGLPGAAGAALVAVPAGYFLVALHTFYGQSWVKTLFKALLLGLAYLLTLLLAATGVFMGGLLFF